MESSLRSKSIALRETRRKSKWFFLETDNWRELKLDLIKASSLSCLRVLDLRTRKTRKWVWITRAAASLREHEEKEEYRLYVAEDNEKFCREVSSASIRLIREESTSFACGYCS